MPEQYKRKPHRMLAARIPPALMMGMDALMEDFSKKEGRRVTRQEMMISIVTWYLKLHAKKLGLMP